MTNIYYFSDLTLHITNPSEINPATIDEVQNCEQKIGCKFEQNYIDFITKFGSGIFGGAYVRLFSPNMILEQYSEFIERCQDYYFWEEGNDILTKEQVLKSIPIGDTFSGDQLIYVNGDYYILPIDEEIIYKVGNQCLKAIEWQLVHNISNEPDEETGDYGHCDENGAYYFEACDFSQ